MNQLRLSFHPPHPNLTLHSPDLHFSYRSFHPPHPMGISYFIVFDLLRNCKAFSGIIGETSERFEWRMDIASTRPLSRTFPIFVQYIIMLVLVQYIIMLSFLLSPYS